MPSIDCAAVVDLERFIDRMAVNSISIGRSDDASIVDGQRIESLTINAGLYCCDIRASFVFDTCILVFLDMNCIPVVRLDCSAGLLGDGNRLTSQRIFVDDMDAMPPGADHAGISQDDIAIPDKDGIFQ